MVNSPEDDNPYAATDVFDDTCEADGSFLVVGANVELPNFCVYTGEPTGPRNRVTEKLRFRDGAVTLTKTCKLNFAISWSMRYRIWAQILAGFLLWLGPLAGVFALSSGERTLLVIAFFLFLTGATLGWFTDGPPALRVRRWEDGHFWIAGCSRQFLKQFRTVSSIAMPRDDQ